MSPHSVYVGTVLVRNIVQGARAIAFRILQSTMSLVRAVVIVTVVLAHGTSRKNQALPSLILPVALW